MHRRALKGSEKFLGPTHPITLIFVRNFGSVLSQLGRYEEAEAMRQRVWRNKELLDKIMKKVLASDRTSWNSHQRQ